MDFIYNTIVPYIGTTYKPESEVAQCEEWHIIGNLPLVFISKYSYGKPQRNTERTYIPKERRYYYDNT